MTVQPAAARWTVSSRLGFIPNTHWQLGRTIDVPLGGTISRYASTGFYSGILHVLASALVTYFISINCDFKQHFRTASAPAHVVVPQPLACCVHTENAWELGGEQGRVRKLSGRRFQLRTKITKLRKRRGRKKPRNVARERALAPLTAQRGRQGPLRVEG